MLLNWHTIDACFLSSFHIQTSFTFFFACLASFFLVISLEFFRRCQRNFHRYLRLKNEFLQEQENAYVMPDEVEEKLLDKGSGEDLRSQKIRPRTVVVVLEQLSRGVIHGCQFTVSYVIMLLFMYSNGTYIRRSFAAEVGEPEFYAECRRIHHDVDHFRCSGWICTVHERYPVPQCLPVSAMSDLMGILANIIFSGLDEKDNTCC
jgi:copper transporter 1